MTTSPNLLDVFERNRFDQNISKRSSAWFQQQVGMLSRQNITADRLLKGGTTHQRSNVMPGNLYMFMYQAKGADTLEYWDRFPLVFPFRAVKGGFYGLNMHYLPYKLRAILMDKLLQFKNNQAFDETTKLKLSWNLISGLSQSQLAAPCVKHYLREQVRSPFIQVYAQDWSTAMMLPVEQFVGASKQKVWSESKKAF